MENSVISQNDELLTREASMASMSLGVGLTLIRKYDFAQLGFFYSSLYSITTGIERLLKLIFIYDHRIRNNDQFPDNGCLKKLGHKLETLYNIAVGINDHYKFDNDNSFYKDDIIYERLIKFLSDFALKSRYYNLDTLTGREQKDIEPLERWDEEISSLILRRHYKPKKERLAEMSKMAEFLTPFTLIDHIADNGQPINSVHELFINSDMGKTKQKYSMYYLYVIIRFLSELYTCLEYEGKFYPYMREFFEIFTLEDRAKILRKKTWNPHPPYQF